MKEDPASNDPPNPYEPPGAREATDPLLPLGEPLRELDAVNMTGGEKPCRVEVYPDRLRFLPESQTPRDVLRGEFADKLRIIDGWLVGRCLEVELDKRSVIQFSADDYDWLTRWMGPPSRDMLRAMFKPRLRFALPLGLLIAVSSLPLPGDQAAGLDPKPFSPITAVLGLGLVVLFFAARYRPHRLWLLADAGWFLLLAVAFGYDILVEGWGWYWALLILLYLSMVSSALVLYRRLGKMQQPPGQADPGQADAE